MQNMQPQKFPIDAGAIVGLAAIVIVLPVETQRHIRGYSKIIPKIGLKTNCYIGVVLEGIFEAFLIKDAD